MRNFWSDKKGVAINSAKNREVERLIAQLGRLEREMREETFPH